MIRSPISPSPASPSADARIQLPRRTVLGLALAAVWGDAFAGRARAEPQIVLPAMRSEISTFAELPVVRPQHVPQDDGMLFYVQHSINANVIVYAARRGANGGLDRKSPIDVFWRRYASKGQKRDLSFFERVFAFGVNALSAGEGRWSVGLVSWHEREGTLDMGPNGQPRLLVPVDKRQMRPVYVYAEAVNDGFIPSIRHIDLYATVDGEKGYVRERVHFG